MTVVKQCFITKESFCEFTSRRGNVNTAGTSGPCESFHQSYVWLGQLTLEKLSKNGNGDISCFVFFLEV